MGHVVDRRAVGQTVSQPTDERAASAILRLLRLVAEADEETRVSAADIMFATRTTERDVREVLDLLAAADLLLVSQPYRSEEGDDPYFHERKSFSFNLHHLVVLFSGEDWRKDFQASRLGLANQGDGDFCLSGWLGQDVDLVRGSYLDVKVTSAFDNQVARITPNGRAVYMVLGLLYPEADVAQAA
jgi:hypothetical protein